MWLLRQLGPRYSQESLAGDLYEEYQLNRTRAWYWRQVLVAIWIGRTAGIRMLVQKARRVPRVRRSPSILKRLMAVLTVTTLSAGALSWASSNSHLSKQRARHDSSATISSSDAIHRHHYGK